MSSSIPIDCTIIGGHEQNLVYGVIPVSLSISHFINFARKLESIQNEQFNLWTWLPSYKIAQKHHGDYADEFSPETADIIKEACYYLAHLKNPNEPLSENQKEWFERCPCGEPHGQEHMEQDI